MYQVTFSNQSLQELDKIDKLEQMPLVEALSNVDIKSLKSPQGEIGHFNRDGKIFYRLRAFDYRIYFEAIDSHTLKCHYILPQHSFTDFAFRFKLPIKEQQLIEHNQNFWEYLETLAK